MPASLGKDIVMTGALIEEAKNIFWRSAEWPERQKFRNELSGWDFTVPATELFVNYGHLQPPATDGPIVGGAVKLLALREQFPESYEKCNVLYLVSSAMPRFSPDLLGYMRRRGVRLVWNQNGVAYRAWSGESYRWRNRAMSGPHREADFVVYQSDFCRRSAERLLGPTPAPWRILFNPVDLTEFRPRAEPRADSPLRLLAAGTNHHFYRVKVPLDCLKVLKARGLNVCLVIAGDCLWKDGHAQALAYASELGVAGDVEFHPAFTRAEAAGLYREADILLHPKYKDPCPTVPIEAMASGVPVVGSCSGGMPELVSEDAGILLEVPDDWERDHWPEGTVFADGVEKIAGSMDHFRTGARRCAEERFNQTKWVASHREIFEGVLHGKG